MRVLAIDTALDRCQAAVVTVDTDGSAALLGEAFSPAAGDAEAIVARVDEALHAAHVAISAIDRVVVTVGPGSFTGVRVGLAYAKGLAFALSIPAVGVSTLEAIARQTTPPVLAALDARHGALYAALYLEETFVPSFVGRLAVDEALARAATAGAAMAGSADAVEALGEGSVVGAVAPVALALAGAGDPSGRQPRALYLADVDAAPQRHKALARA